MQRYVCAVCLVLLPVFFSISLVAQAPPSADAYVTSTQPAANFGASSILPVQSGTISYIRLNLGVIPANSTIAKATLRLYVNAVAAPGSFDVYQVGDAWTEGGISYNNAPVLGASATGGHRISVTAASRNQFVLVDITSLAQAWANGSIPNNGVALALTSATGSFAFDSKESGRQPELEIVLGSRPTASVLAVGTSPASSPNVLVGQQGPSQYIDNGTMQQTGANFNIGGSGLSGVTSGLNWPVVTKSADYAVQVTDFATPSTSGNYLILIGTTSHTFTLPKPAPANGSCVAIGNVADGGINSGTNVFLTVSPNGLLIDNSSVLPTMPRRTAYLYCSDGLGYYRLGYQQNGVSEIGPWLYSVDTGTQNALTTTFRNGMDFGLNTGSMIILLPKFANTSGTPTLNVNGLGAKKILKHGNQALSPSDLTTTALALLIYDGQFWELLNPQTIKSTLTGATGSIGGSALTAGTCAAGTAAVTGAVVGHPVSVGAADGSLPNPLILLSAAVTSSNTVTVQLCAVASVTPAAKTYNVATQ